MIRKLKVKNYVLIDELEIDLDKGLTIITGETGAGKSIFLGALNLIIGQRADSSSLLDKKSKCIIEATFDIGGLPLESFFQDNDLDFDIITLVRREINAEGKSRAFINDTPVNLSVLKDFAEGLIDIHSQHENLLLNNSAFQLRLVDVWAETAHELDEYKNAYQQYKNSLKEIEQAESALKKFQAEQDFISFQFEELSHAGIRNGELIELEAEQKLRAHANEIISHLEQANNLLSSDENGIIRNIQSVVQLYNHAAKYDTQLEELELRLKSVLVEVRDLNNESIRLQQSIEIDPERLELVEARLSELYRLLKKYQCSTEEELIQLRDSIDQKIASANDLELQVELLRNKVMVDKKQLEDKAKVLSEKRRNHSSGLSERMMKGLKEVMMPDSNIEIKWNTINNGNYFDDGSDKVQLYFSANKGMEARAIEKVASGGELSRLMLCIKSILAEKTNLPTILFDEIDTGISGETASRLGYVMRKMSENHQLIAITHLPQIASKGHNQYLVYKEKEKGQVRTRLRKLNQDERIQEIARLLSGEKLTDAALGNARALLEQA